MVIASWLALLSIGGEVMRLKLLSSLYDLNYVEYVLVCWVGHYAVRLHEIESLFSPFRPVAKSATYFLVSHHGSTRAMPPITACHSMHDIVDRKVSFFPRVD